MAFQHVYLYGCSSSLCSYFVSYDNPTENGLWKQLAHLTGRAVDKEA